MDWVVSGSHSVKCPEKEEENGEPQPMPLQHCVSLLFTTWDPKFLVDEQNMIFHSLISESK